MTSPDFAYAFARLNGRPPSVDETKAALALAGIVAETQMDPILLLFIADARAADERRRLPAAIAAGVKQIQAAMASPAFREHQREISNLEAAIDAVLGLGRSSLTWGYAFALAALLAAAGTGWAVHAADSAGEHSRICAAAANFTVVLANQARHDHEPRAAAFLGRGWSPSKC